MSRIINRSRIAWLVLASMLVSAGGGVTAGETPIRIDRDNSAALDQLGIESVFDADYSSYRWLRVTDEQLKVLNNY